VNACPNEKASVYSCLNSTDWTANIPFSNKVTIIKRRSMTVFDRYNYTILQTLLAEEWEATNYGYDDFFPIYDAVFKSILRSRVGIQAHSSNSCTVHGHISRPKSTRRERREQMKDFQT
jgi:hypothetical protein